MHALLAVAHHRHGDARMGRSSSLWGGVFLYVTEARKPETLERYGHATPDDWLERNVYRRHPMLGIVLMGGADLLLFGLVPGALILATQIVWIPLWTAGVINGIGLLGLPALANTGRKHSRS